MSRDDRGPAPDMTAAGSSTPAGRVSEAERLRRWRLVLGADGALHVVDPTRAAVTDSLAVVDAWREPLDWEQPRPTLEVVGSTAYVTEPATREVHVVDLDRLAVVTTFELPEVPNELVGVSG